MSKKLKENMIELLPEVAREDYTVIIIAVGHQTFLDIGLSAISKWEEKNCVLFDLKYISKVRNYYKNVNGSETKKSVNHWNSRFHWLSKLLLNSNWDVLGVDAFTDYYDVSLKRARNKILLAHNSFQSSEFDLQEGQTLIGLCQKFEPEVIIHLAAQAGVRHSIENPRSYVDSNLVGSFNVLLESAGDLSFTHGIHLFGIWSK